MDIKKKIFKLQGHGMKTNLQQINRAVVKKTIEQQFINESILATAKMLEDQSENKPQL
jgi:hypothetical protein